MILKFILFVISFYYVELLSPCPFSVPNICLNDGTCLYSNTSMYMYCQCKKGFGGNFKLLNKTILNDSD